MTSEFVEQNAGFFTWLISTMFNDSYLVLLYIVYCLLRVIEQRTWQKTFPNRLSCLSATSSLHCWVKANQSGLPQILFPGLLNQRPEFISILERELRHDGMVGTRLGKDIDLMQAWNASQVLTTAFAIGESAYDDSDYDGSNATAQCDLISFLLQANSRIL